MNQSPQEATRAGEHQIFLQDGSISSILYCTLLPEIWQEIRRRANIAVFNQRLTLADRELHTGDVIPPNCTIILGFQSQGGTPSHGLFQCLDVCVLQALTLSTVYERTLRTYMRVSTNWHLQVHFSLEQSQWGREFKTAGNNAAVYIERQHCRLKLPLEVEDIVNTVLELMLCFSANQQTCMTGIKYLWRALTRRRSGDSVKVFTYIQTRSVLSVAMRTLRLHGYQRTPWDPRPSVFPVHHNPEMEGDGARINACLALVVALVHSAGWTSIMDANSHPGPGEFPGAVARFVIPWTCPSPHLQRHVTNHWACGRFPSKIPGLFQIRVGTNPITGGRGLSAATGNPRSYISPHSTERTCK